MSYYISYESFGREIRQRIEALLSIRGGDTLESVSVTKNNGVRLDGLTLKRGNEPAAVIYIQDLYDAYREGVDPDRIVEDSVDHLMETCPYFPLSDLDNLLCYEKMRTLLTMKLVNYEKNREMLKERAYIRKLDLAIEFRISYNMEKRYQASTAVSKSMMLAWGVSEEELFEQACKNMDHLWHPLLLPMSQVFLDLMEYEGMSPEIKMQLVKCLLPEFLQEEGPVPFYVLTNQLRQDAAILWFSTDLIREFARKSNCRVFILPSSIHEVLLMPDKGLMPPEEISCMIHCVNREEVEEKDFLSDHLYVYDPAADEYSIVL